MNTTCKQTQAFARRTNPYNRAMLDPLFPSICNMHSQHAQRGKPRVHLLLDTFSRPARCTRVQHLGVQNPDIMMLSLRLAEYVRPLHIRKMHPLVPRGDMATFSTRNPKRKKNNIHCVTERAHHRVSLSCAWAAWRERDVFMLRKLFA